MGTNLSKTRLTPPEIIDRIQSDELAALIKQKLKPNYLRISDHSYDIYSLIDLRRFLNVVTPWTQFLPEGNIALQLLGRERIWYDADSEEQSRTKLGIIGEKTHLCGLSSTFGFIVGDIRLPDEPYTPKHCSANFFVDRNRQIWIVESRTGRVYQPTLQTTIEIVLI